MKLNPDDCSLEESTVVLFKTSTLISPMMIFRRKAGTGIGMKKLPFMDLAMPNVSSLFETTLGAAKLKTPSISGVSMA